MPATNISSEEKNRRKQEELDFVPIRSKLKDLILKEYPSIEKFCFENNLPKSSVNDVIRGYRFPSLRTIMRIGAALDVPVAKILKGI